MKRLFIALLMTLHPALAKGAVEPNIEFGNFAFNKPYLMSVSYARSAQDNALFALAITTKNQAKDKNRLDIPTALSVNCKTGLFTAGFGYDAEDAFKVAKLITGSFCFMHKKQWRHTSW